MALALTLTPKRLLLVLEAIEARIEAQVAQYQITPPSEDAAGDYGNDLHDLRLQRDALLALKDSGPWTAGMFECWSDPEDNSLSLFRADNHQARNMLSDKAVLLYQFVAHTHEEAMAIHYLRQGWSPYVPMGDAAPCPTCATAIYPQCYGVCWRCGNVADHADDV
jgi:hypothetical protein